MALKRINYCFPKTVEYAGAQQGIGVLICMSRIQMVTYNYIYICMYVCMYKKDSKTKIKRKE